jgi:hypothetical protein
MIPTMNNTTPEPVALPPLPPKWHSADYAARYIPEIRAARDKTSVNNPLGPHVDWLLEEIDWLRQQLAAAGTTVTEWAVAYGCPSGDPNEAAGNFAFDDEGDARECVQWVRGGILAKRLVTTGRWEAVTTGE